MTCDDMLCINPSSATTYNHSRTDTPQRTPTCSANDGNRKKARGVHWGACTMSKHSR
jgi:hypothetical protein